MVGMSTETHCRLKWCDEMMRFLTLIGNNKDEKTHLEICEMLKVIFVNSLCCCFDIGTWNRFDAKNSLLHICASCNQFNDNNQHHFSHNIGHQQRWPIGLIASLYFQCSVHLNRFDCFDGRTLLDTRRFIRLTRFVWLSIHKFHRLWWAIVVFFLKFLLISIVSHSAC